MSTAFAHDEPPPLSLDGLHLDNSSGWTAEVKETSDNSDQEEEGVAGSSSTPSAKKKKKKKPKKKKAAAGLSGYGRVPDEEPAPPPETTDEREKRIAALESGPQRLVVPHYAVLRDSVRPSLSTFLTPSCQRLELLTPRLRLRQVRIEDTTGIRKIKMEPVVQKTQLYGSPSMSDIKDSFQSRYILSSIPRVGSEPTGSRKEYVFALTAREPGSVTLGPPGQIRITNRLNTTEGYLGNMALQLSTNTSGPSLFPKPKSICRHPTFEQTKQAELTGRIFYEIHPQLWGQGLMSEAFAETLRFAFEEVGCTTVEADPTTANPASIRLCTKHGMRHTHTSIDNPYGKPQAYHEITRDEWWKRNRPGREVTDHWGGKEVCRWCLNFRLATPTIRCHRCDWVRYCSKECQWADWVNTKGHQEECDGSKA